MAEICNRGKSDRHATSVTNRLHFFYDTQDKQAMVEFNGVKYSYAYNLQGDVIGIIDSTGNLVVQYSYDAWGITGQIVLPA